MEMPVYMLANQLPLLELGRKPAIVRGQIDQHCRPDGELHAQRILGKLPIYAFSDPNDILSYPGMHVFSRSASGSDRRGFPNRRSRPRPEIRRRAQRP